MPFCRVETNVDLNNDAKENLAGTVSKLISSALGKPEQRVMVLVHDSTVMTFGGTTDATAFVTLGSIGLSPDQRLDISDKVCTLLDSEYGISSKRIYIDFRDLERSMVGWDGHTF